MSSLTVSAAAAAGDFKDVEYLFPYDHLVGELAARRKQHGLEQVLFNVPPGDWARASAG